MMLRMRAEGARWTGRIHKLTSRSREWCIDSRRGSISKEARNYGAGNDLDKVPSLDMVDLHESQLECYDVGILQS